MASPSVAIAARLGALALGLLPVVAVAGPPPLPPLPGERRAPEPDTPEPEAPKPTSEPAPTKPAPGGDGPKPAPSSKTAAKPAEVSTPGAPAPTSEVPAPAARIETTEPPQPEPLREPPKGPAPDPAHKGDELELPTAAPADQTERPRLPVLPPPPRPPYGGTGMFVGAGVTFVVAVTEQVVAHLLVKRRCTDPVQRRIDEDAANMPTDPMQDLDGNGIPDVLEVTDETERAGELVIDCIPGVVPALALRVHSDLGLLATIGLATAGGMLRSRRQAYDDAFGRKPRRHFTGLRAAGITLIATGVVTWFSTGAGTWGWLSSCDHGDCVTKARLTNFLTRDLSALMVASGGAMLGFAEAHRRNFDRYERDRAWSVGPAVSRGHVGLSLAGRF